MLFFKYVGTNNVLDDRDENHGNSGSFNFALHGFHAELRIQPLESPLSMLHLKGITEDEVRRCEWCKFLQYAAILKPAAYSYVPCSKKCERTSQKRFGAFVWPQSPSVPKSKL